MIKLREILILAVLALCLIAGTDYDRYTSGMTGGKSSLEVIYSDVNDTAQVILFEPTTGRDSFPYSDTIGGAWAATYDSVITWTPPPMIVRLDITSPIDSAATYYCLLDCGTSVYGYTYDPPGIDTTVATFSAAMVDSINNVVAMKDTIQGEDSIANGYVLCRWLVAQDGLEGDARGVIRVGAGDAGTELAIGDSTIVTIEMVCDSMAAYINAFDTVSNHVTAVNSGDSGYTVTADKKGEAFTGQVGDTAQDTTLTQANVTSLTVSVDTFPVVGDTRGKKSLSASILIDPNPGSAADAGIGNDDSGYIYVYGVYENMGFADTWKLLDSHRTDGLPTSLSFRVPDDVGDTTLGTQIWMVTKIYDSCTDVNDTLTYTLRYDFRLF